MLLIVTGVGSLIHLFSVGYMREDPGYARYFAYLNLFVVFMLVLVLGSSFPVMFIGWEGVGLCSYLLIGFWFTRQGQRRRRQEGVHHEPDRRLRLPGRDVPASGGRFGSLDFVYVIAARAADVLRAGRRDRHRDHPVPLPRLHRQVGPDPALHLAARRDGRPDAGLGPDPRGHDGDRRRLPGGADQRAVRAGAGLEHGGGRASARSPRSSPPRSASASTTSRRCWRTPPSRSSATCSSASGTGAYAAGHLPPGDARLLQGAAVPRLRQRDPRDAPRLSRHPLARGRPGHAEHGRAPAVHAGDLLAHADRDAGHRRASRRSPASSPRTRSWPRPSPAGRSSRSTTCSTAWASLAALLTAFYMARLMAMTFLGENRTGEQERGAPARGALDHDRAARRARRAERRGRRAQPAAPGRRARGARALARAGDGAGAAVHPPGHAARARPSTAWSAPRCAIGVLGLLAGFRATLGAAHRRPRTTRRRRPGFALVLNRKYYIDELYDAVVVRPVVWLSRVVLWRGVDQGWWTARRVNGTAWLSRLAGGGLPAAADRAGGRLRGALPRGRAVDSARRDPVTAR